MQRQIRRVALLVFLLFAALLLNLNYLQVVKARTLAEDPRNSRGLFREYDVERGTILVGTGQGQRPIASSQETDGALRFLRGYPEGSLYAPVTGFHSFIYGREGLERTFNDFLVGSAPETFARNLADLLAGRERIGDSVSTTIIPAAQEAAAAALGERRGAVVALEPSTGAILALWSAPSYDPNGLASHDQSVVTATWEATEADPSRPRLNRALRETYPPGSTFKLVTAAAALQQGVGPSSAFPDPAELDVPQTSSDIGNFGGGLCNGGQPLTLQRAMEVSCNTTFAQLGLDVGTPRLVAQAEAFGLNAALDFQLPVVGSVIPTELDAPSLAQSAIGQRDVRVTPLQMALVSAAIGNGGVLMTPRVVHEVEDYAGRPLRAFGPEPLVLPGQADAQAVPAAVAGQLRDMMVGVVERGSGRRAAIDGVGVAGKTGTAEVAEGRNPTVWFVGFAPAVDPRVAVAVVVEDGGEIGTEATGGQVAAPIAQAVMAAVLATQEQD